MNLVHAVRGAARLLQRSRMSSPGGGGATCRRTFGSVKRLCPEEVIENRFECRTRSRCSSAPCSMPCTSATYS